VSHPVTFTVTIPRAVLEDVALNLAGIELSENVGRSELAKLLHEVIMAGLEDYIGEHDDVEVR